MGHPRRVPDTQTSRSHFCSVIRRLFLLAGVAAIQSAGQRLDPHSGKSVAKHCTSARVQGTAVAIFRQPPQQLLHGLYFSRQCLKFREFFAGELLPALRGGSALSKTEKQLPDLIETEAGLARLLYHGDAVKNGDVVAPLSADALGRRKDANLLVVADGGGLKPNLARHFRNSQLGHGDILGQHISTAL